MKKILLIVLISVSAVSVGLAQQASYLVTGGNGNGIKFWSDDSYKIHMGAAPEYYYGPVTDYSIKTNMSSGTPGRGWTWGVIGQTPVAAINASTGHMQIAGFFNAQGINLDRSSWPFIQFSENGTLGARIQGTGGMFAVTSTNGASNWLTVNSTTGNVGIGTNTPVSKLDVNGPISVNGVGVITNGGSDVQANIRVIRNTSPTSSDGLYLGYGGSGGPIRFFSNSGSTEFMSLTTAGNLGIGTTSPVSKLDIAGDVQISNSGIPMGLMTEASGGTAPILNMSMNFREANRNNTYRGAGIRIDSRTGFPLFQFITRSAGTTVENVPFVLLENGNVGIGSQNPNQKLTVNGTIYGKEVKVDLSVPGPDYVFLNTYSLRSLAEVEDYIKSNQHLPEVPSAAQMEKEGINLSEMNMLLLKKVEEVTLYLIELKKENNLLRERVGVLESKASGNK